MAKLRRVGRAGAHAASLLFTAWALLATSAPDPVYVPAQDCFSGVAPNAALQITLAGPAAGSDGGDGSGGGDGSEADGDASGGDMSIAHDDASRAADGASADAATQELDAGMQGDAAPLCVGASAQDPCVSSCRGIDGILPGGALVLDVTYLSGEQTVQPACTGYQTRGMQGVTGVILSTQAQPTNNVFTTAGGTFALSDAPGCSGLWSLTLEPITPAVPGGALVPLDASAGWQVVRAISFSQAQFCSQTFPVRGALLCQDTFPVSAIAGRNQ